MAEAHATMIPFVERMPRPPMVEQHRTKSWITDRLAEIPLGQTTNSAVACDLFEQAPPNLAALCLR